MDRYSHADRAALPELAGWLLNRCRFDGPAPCHDGGADRGEPEVGHFLALGPTGRVDIYRTRQAGQFGKGSMWRPVGLVERGVAQLDLDPLTHARGAEAPLAPLPAAFRLCRSAERRPAAQFRVRVESPGGIGTGVVTGTAQRSPLVGIAFPRHGYVPEQYYCAFDADRDLGMPIGAYEDQILLAQLDALGEDGEGYELRAGSDLGSLAAAMSRLNDRRPRGLRLDTAIVGTHMGMTLLENQFGAGHWRAGYPFYGGRPLYQNMAVLGGLSLLHHPGIPVGSAFAVSSGQGPVFVHGPSSIHCTGDGLAVARRYGVIEPPRAAPECPWGVRLCVEGDRRVEWHYG